MMLEHWNACKIQKTNSIEAASEQQD